MLDVLTMMLCSTQHLGRSMEMLFRSNARATLVVEALLCCEVPVPFMLATQHAMIRLGKARQNSCCMCCLSLRLMPTGSMQSDKKRHQHGTQHTHTNKTQITQHCGHEHHHFAQKDHIAQASEVHTKPLRQAPTS